MHPRPVEFQDAALQLAARTGEAECFMRRLVSQSVEFDGSRLGLIGELESVDFVVRVLVKGCEGLSAGLPANERGVKTLVERAVWAAASGRQLRTILVAPHSVAIPDATWTNQSDGLHVVTRTREVIDWLSMRWPRYHWSGACKKIHGCFRVRNSAGADVGTTFCHWRLSVRCRGTSQHGVSDRLFEVGALDADNLCQLLENRLCLEIPSDDRIADCLEKNVIALGVAPLSRILAALPSRKSLCESVEFGSKILICDAAPPGGCDEEGVISGVANLVAHGKATPWQAVGLSASSPTGRAWRDRVDRTPQVRPGALRWEDSSIVWPEKVLLIPDIAALTVSDDGIVSGTPVEAVVLEQGRPTTRCKPPGITIHLAELMGSRFLGCPSTRLCAGFHCLPPLVYN